MRISLLLIVVVQFLNVDGNRPLLDTVFGEALLNSISAGLKKKLVDVHNEGTMQFKPVGEMGKMLQQRLTPEEIVELETAYKRLLLPMLKEQSGHQLNNLEDIPIRLKDIDEGDDEEEEEESYNFEEGLEDDSESRETKKSNDEL